MYRAEMSVLRATKGLKPGRLCELRKGATILGRNPKRCDVVLDHFAVSREHARIEQLDDATYIEDLNSRNGVLVNGLPIRPGVSGRQRLYPNDRIEIAAFEFIYEEEPSGDSVIVISDETDTKPDILSTVDVSQDSSRQIPVNVRVSKLQTVLTIIEELANALEPNEVLPKIIESLFRSFPQAQNGYVLLRDPRTNQFAPAAVRRQGGSPEPIRISRTIVEQVVQKRTAILSGDVASDTRFEMSASVRALRLRSMISAPLIGSEGDVLGLIQLEVTGGSDRFTPDDLDVLAGVGRHLAIVIENSQLHDRALRAQRTEFEQRFRRLIEGSIQGILIHRDFAPLFVNEAWAALHGYTVDEVMHMESVLPLVAEEDREQTSRYAAACLSGKASPARHESRAIRKDGSLFWLERFTTAVDWDSEPAIQSAVVDLTDRKRAEEVLRRDQAELERLVQERAAELAEANHQLQAEIAERRHAEAELRASGALYHSLVDHIPLCVARKDLEGRFTFVNRALCELFEMRSEQIVGRTDHDFFDKQLADKYRHDDEHVARTGERLELFETIDVPRHRTLYIHTLKTPIHDAGGQAVGTQLIFGDITSLKKTEEERNRAVQELERSNRDLEQFAYSVSHDLQSPLRTVTSYCQLLQRRYAGRLDAEADEFLAGAIDGSKRMKRLLEDLLAYSRVTTEGHQFRPVQCEAILNEAVSNLDALIVENQAQITHDPLPEVTGDGTQLMQLFQNLIGNAIRYRSDQPPRVHVSAESTPRTWRFSVRDNGVGIDRQHYDRIFQIFQRLYSESEIGGTGVGLSICKRIVERHGGRIWVESQAGQGSVFYFTIPKKQKARERKSS